MTIVRSQKILQVKGPLILLCQIISVECPTNLNFPLLTSNQNKGSPKQPIGMKHESKFVGHSTEIIRQSKIKEPLTKSLTVFGYLKQNTYIHTKGCLKGPDNISFFRKNDPLKNSNRGPLAKKFFTLKREG